MSILLGNPGDRWSLAEAVDALGDAAKRAGVPGMIWVAGAFYPSLNMNVELVQGLLAFTELATGIDLPGEAGTGSLFSLFGPAFWIQDEGFLRTALNTALLVPVLFVLYRLIVGLAHLSDPRIWEAAQEESVVQVHIGVIDMDDLKQRKTARLRSVWRAGKGLGVVAFAMWLMLFGLLLGAMVVLIGPLVVVVQVLGLSQFSPLLAGLLVPILALLLVYAVVLMVLNQLALHSLAHNRRGVASALTHAWRLVRTSPMSTLRATLVDFVLFVSIVVLAEAIQAPLRTTHFAAWLSPVLVFFLYGFAGVTRAGFWARAYRSLGGLSSADRVPGLSQSSP